MNKQTLLALALIGGILLITASPWYKKNVMGIKPKPAAEVTADSTLAAAPPQATNAAEQMTAEPARLSDAPQTQAPAQPSLQAMDADTLWIETPLYRGALSTLGGGTVIHWELKKYLKGDKTLGQPVNLIPEGAYGNLAMVLDGGVDLSTCAFDVLSDERIDTESGPGRRVVLSTTLESGATVKRIFTFLEDRYDFGLDVAMEGISTYDAGYVLSWQSGLQSTEPNIGDDGRYVQSMAMQGGELFKTKTKSTGFSEGSTDWSAVRTKYFVSAFIPRSQKGRGVRLSGEKGQMLDEASGKTVNWNVQRMGLAMAGSLSSEVDVFIGPLDLPTVKALDVKLEESMNFGWAIIQPISKLFYHVLQAMFGVIGNYGWTIILFAIMIKIVLYPLTRKSFDSMRKMQQLQPRIKNLQEKYKSDPQRMNKEVMALYKENNVNPMGGCLPMLLQMPVLFALFNLFRTTIMLRQAEWLMISDLSAPDGILMGIHILPLILGVTMIFQQKLSGGNNPQQKMMAYMMPVMFTFMFYRIAAGLNLYYMMFNLLTIAQEVLVKRKREEAAEVA